MSVSKKSTASVQNGQVLKRILGLAKPYKWIFALAAFLSVVLAPLAIVRPYLVQLTVDKHILTNDYDGLVIMVGALFVILIIEGLLSYIFSYSTSWLGQSIIRDTRIKVFRHINSLRLSYFDKTPIGTNMTRTISDLETINTVFSEGIITIIADILTLIFVLAIMFYTSWSLTLVCLSIFPLLLIASYWFKESVKKSYEQVRNLVATLNSFLQERISGMRLVQIFNTEKQEKQKFETISRDYTRANLNSIFPYAVFFPLVEIFSAASLGLMVWYGARGVLAGEVTLGILVAFPLYLGQLFRPIRMLADKFNSLQMGLVAANRVFELLDNKEQIANEGKIIPTHLKGDIVFNQVFFSYQQDKKVAEIEDWILQNISFRLPEGETLAIVGSTGAGKSTIINILSRFYEIHKGNIFIGKENLKSFELYALRRKIAVVLQDVFLFSGTIFENISLNDKTVSKEQVIASAQLIGAHEFIMRLPDNYDYQVRERGATLSMGQRQLISFVRALVFNPDILVLDEATSAIDPETEATIQNAIEKLISRRTSIIIAHRLSTIQHAQQIMVLEKGHIAEIGSPAELMQLKNGHYRQLVEASQQVEH
jgi:ATP-binding cassette, subfamily B, multidrug efflux pump